MGIEGVLQHKLMCTQRTAMTDDQSYFKGFRAYVSRVNFTEVYKATLNDICQDLGPQLSSVRSCLAIGPAGTHSEAKFMKHCAPHIRKFLAVEPCPDAVQHLRRYLPTKCLIILRKYHKINLKT